MRVFAALACLLLAGCGSEQDGAIVILDPDYAIDHVATSDSGFTSPDGLLWFDGGLLMADEGGRSIRSWVPGQDAVTLVGPENGFTSPEDLVRDAEGNIWFTDDNEGGLRRVGSDGEVTLIAGPDQGLESTEGIVLSPDGDLIVGDGVTHQLFTVSPGGEVRVLAGAERGITKPESLAFDENGNLYIADNEDDVLYLLGTDGTLTQPVRGYGELSPESITFADGVLYITDSKNGRLWRYTPEFGLEGIASFAQEFANVQGVTVSPSGDIFLSIRAGPEDMRGYILRLARKRG